MRALWSRCRRSVSGRLRGTSIFATNAGRSFMGSWHSLRPPRLGVYSINCSRSSAASPVASPPLPLTPSPSEVRIAFAKESSCTGHASRLARQRLYEQSVAKARGPRTQTEGSDPLDDAEASDATMSPQLASSRPNISTITRSACTTWRIRMASPVVDATAGRWPSAAVAPPSQSRTGLWPDTITRAAIDAP